MEAKRERMKSRKSAPNNATHNRGVVQKPRKSTRPVSKFIVIRRGLIKHSVVVAIPNKKVLPIPLND